jgi:surface antigen
LPGATIRTVTNIIFRKQSQDKLTKELLDEESVSKKLIRKKNKNLKKYLYKNSFTIVNGTLILVVFGLISFGTHFQSRNSTLSIFSNNSSQSSAPLDVISSADIASNIANITRLPEAVDVSNLADSQDAQVSSATTDQSIITKPQFLSGGANSVTTIRTYVTVAGDSVSSIATKFGITSNTILWSNNLSSDNLSPGTSLLIPPRNGVIYKVQSGDTLDSIASKFSADKSQIVAFNNLEIKSISVGLSIFIPDGSVPVVTYQYNYSAAGFLPQYGDNGYSFGYCTWYVASKISVPRNWGNANTWAYYARLSGWTVSSVPVPGSIFQTTAGWAGHVGIVEEVYPNGTMLISEMNAYGYLDRALTRPGGGWDVVNYRITSTSSYSSYIYH